MGCSRASRASMVVWVGWRQREGQTWRRLIRSYHLYDRRSPQLISEVNAAVKQCHAVPIAITIGPILFAALRWTTFTDSGFHTGERQRHQQGWLVCATAPVSVLHWRSRKLTRKARSPQLVETYAASSAVVEMTWIKALWESMTWKDFDILTQRRSSHPLKTMMPHVRAHLLWIPKVCLMRWIMIYTRMTGNLLCMCQSLKSLCAEQCVDLDGVHTIEMQLTP